jgi:hypothetical protein
MSQETSHKLIYVKYPLMKITNVDLKYKYSIRHIKKAIHLVVICSGLASLFIKFIKEPYRHSIQRQ